MSTSITENYLPPVSDISAGEALAMRTILEQNLQILFADVDMRPNTPLGDLFISPAARLLTAVSVAQDRLQSDLNLENAANGIVYDCPFVENLIQNVGAMQNSVTLSYGVLRLVFPDDSPITLDRSTTFTTASGHSYQIRLPENGPFYVRSVGSSRVVGTNDAIFVSSVGEGFWVDVPVQGTYITDAPPEAGEAFSVEFGLETLVAATVLQTMTTGIPDTALVQAARRTREIVYTATPCTKGGLRSFVKNNYPNSMSVTGTTNGDSEQYREALAPTGHFLDVWVRGGILLRDTIIIRGVLDPVENQFLLELNTPSPLVHFEGLHWVGDPTLTLDPAAIKTYSVSTDVVNAPLGAASRTVHEKIWVVVDNVTDLALDPLITTLVDPDNGDEYAEFECAYYQDPNFQAIERDITSDDHTPMGLNTLVHYPSLLILNSFLVRYRKQPGTAVNLNQAREEIYTYLTTLTWPATYNTGRISDIMFYAGAADIVTIQPSGYAEPVPTQYIADPGADPAADLADFKMGADLVSLWPITTEANLGMQNNEIASYYGVGPENFAIFILKELITFEEVL
jgi:hypothetical protein